MRVLTVCIGSMKIESAFVRLYHFRSFSSISKTDRGGIRIHIYEQSPGTCLFPGQPSREGWKNRFDATVALGRIKKLMEFPVGDDLRRKRLLRRANDIESCIGAVISEMADQQAFRPFPAANEAEK